jgi:hypothetical protein
MDLNVVTTTNEPDSMPDLSKPHPDFPFLSRAKLYDAITSMYLDCRNDGEIAAALSEEHGRPISAQAIAGIRLEAAVAAEHQPSEIRRRWIYRYRKMTVNNLVKEFMFMEGMRNFAKGKRELANEIDLLVKNTPPDRICITVNDVLGRNNIGMDLINELQAYAVEDRKMNEAVRPYAEKHLMPQEQALAQVARMLALTHNAERAKDPEKSTALLSEILADSSQSFTQSDVSFLVEYDRLQAEAESASMMGLIARAGDLARPPSVLEQAIEGTAHHFAYPELVQIVDSMRSTPVMSRSDLAQVREYASRHRKDLATLKELGYVRSAPPGMAKMELEMLENVLTLTEQHLSLLDYRTFLTNHEISNALRHKITSNDLKTILDRLNASSTPEEIESLADRLLEGHNFEFPLVRYLARRFTLKT